MIIQFFLQKTCYSSSKKANWIIHKYSPNYVIIENVWWLLIWRTMRKNIINVFILRFLKVSNWRWKNQKKEHNMIFKKGIKCIETLWKQTIEKPKNIFYQNGNS